MQRAKWHKVLLALAAAGLASACPAADAVTRDDAADPSAVVSSSDNQVLVWNQQLLGILHRRRDFPPPAARSLAILHLAIDDAVNAITPTHESYAGGTETAPAASPEIAAAIAGHDALVALYPKEKALLDACLSPTLAQLSAKTTAEAAELGKAVGSRSANRILALRAKDGSTSAVVPSFPREPGVWRPTRPAFRAPIFPQYACLKPFAMTSCAQFRPLGPPALNSPEFSRCQQEVMRLGGYFSAERTTGQTEIALFWSDGLGSCTPPGHWNIIAQHAARDHSLGLAQSARLFALLNVAVADAAISSWEAKYHFNFWRPVTAADCADQVPATASMRDQLWTPFLITPPFPEYPSGHAVFSAAAAEVLTAYFGDTSFSDISEYLPETYGRPNLTRTFASYRLAAQEAGRSRIYGGIHYEFSDRDGIACGAAIGRYVLSTQLQLNSPRVAPVVQQVPEGNSVGGAQ